MNVWPTPRPPTIDSAGRTARRAARAAGKAARRTGEGSVDRTQSIASSARDAVNDGIRTVTLQEFRDVAMSRRRRFNAAPVSSKFRGHH